MISRQVQSSVGIKNTLERSDNDFYRTHPSAVRALLAVEKFSGTVWEAACGDGAISEVLETVSEITEVISTDLIDRGYGLGEVDFLKTPSEVFADHLITNPPFKLCEEFVAHGLRVVPVGGKVAIIARLLWLEGSRRRDRLFSRTPPARVWVFSSRVPMARGDMDYRIGMVAFAWFVFVRGSTAPPVLGWL